MINIKNGKNTLLVKTLNKFGDYSFALNICEPESNYLYAGNRVAGLKFYIDRTSHNHALPNREDQSLKLNSYPNPAREYARIRFTLPSAAATTVNIYDLNGRLVRSLLDEMLPAGDHELTWNLDSDAGRLAARGIYLCELVSGNQQNSIRLVIK